ncbi:MAG: nuclear transport factor 2 family protein [Erythrobacter sp.]|nr:nuclear transport factor 2 family protein [Erythrobacter sp.]
MSKIEGTIQAQQLRFLQSWMHRSTADLKRLTTRDCVFMFGSNPPELLDRVSFVDALERDFRCIGFRLGESIVRRHGRSAWFVAPIDLELKLGAREWKGRFLITSLWVKGALGGWKMADTSISPVAEDERLAESVRRLQMW